MMQNNLRKKVRKANENLKKLYDWMDEVNLIEKMTTYTDLKLHKCCGYCGDETFPDEMKAWIDVNYPNLFDYFCEDQYRFLNEMCEEKYKNEFHEMIDPIGHTSKFYMKTVLAHGNPKEYNAVKDILWDLNCNTYYYDFDIIDDKNNFITIDTIKDFYHNYDYSISELIDLISVISDECSLEELKEKYSPYIELFDYIEEFKEEQIEIYNEYLKDMYDDYKLGAA